MALQNTQHTPCMHGRMHIWSPTLSDGQRTNSDKGQVAGAKARVASMEKAAQAVWATEVEEEEEAGREAEAKAGRASQALVVPLAELVREVGIVAWVSLG